MSLYDITVLDREGNEVKLDKYQNKVLLIVNTATGCGFTPQYEELQKLYDELKEKGFEILDFPCNQFHEQASGSDEEIHTFCTAKYHTTFDRFKKIDVNGVDASPLFTFLKAQKGYVAPKGLKKKTTMNLVSKLSQTKGTDDVRWNFTKFLVDKNGNVVERFEPVESVSDYKDKILALL